MRGSLDARRGYQAVDVTRVGFVAYTTVVTSDAAMTHGVPPIARAGAGAVDWVHAHEVNTVSYRDENEALHARVESLEEELARKQRALDAAVSSKRRRRRGTRAPWIIALSAALGAALVGGLVFRSAPSARAPVAPPPAFVPPPPPTPVVAPPVPPPAPAPVVAPEPVVARSRSDEVSWSATVRALSNRTSPAVGTACTIHANVHVGSSYMASPDPLTIECGGVSLYDWSASVGVGLESRSCWILEQPAGDTPADARRGVFRYVLSCADHGQRSGGRPQLDLSTAARTATVFQADPQAQAVSLDVEPLSTERAGYGISAPASRPGATVEHAVMLVGTVTAVVGAAGTRVGAACTAQIDPVPYAHLNCHVVLRCAGRTLYGAGHSGDVACAVRDGAPVTAHDTAASVQDGDPGFDLDVPAGTIHVLDEVDGHAWSVAIALRAR